MFQQRPLMTANRIDQIRGAKMSDTAQSYCSEYTSTKATPVVLLAPRTIAV